MATITGNIISGADDGLATSGGLYFADNMIVIYPGRGAWFKLSGITIPQGSTVTSAILKNYCYALSANVEIQIIMDGRASPANPTIPAQVFTPTSIAGSLVGNVTHTVPTPNLFNKDNYALTQNNVTTLVQTLVNSHNYSNGDMMFYWTLLLNTIYVYQFDWGTTKNTSLEIIYSTGDDYSSSSSSSSSSESSSSQPPELVPKTVYRFL